jgi:hypothetical protein
MEERDVRELVSQVKTGRLSRREFTRTMVGVGLTPRPSGAGAGRCGFCGGRGRPS